MRMNDVIPRDESGLQTLIYVRRPPWNDLYRHSALYESPFSANILSDLYLYPHSNASTCYLQGSYKYEDMEFSSFGSKGVVRCLHQGAVERTDILGVFYD